MSFTNSDDEYTFEFSGTGSGPQACPQFEGTFTGSVNKRTRAFSAEGSFAVKITIPCILYLASRGVIKIPQFVQDWLYMDQWPSIKRTMLVYAGSLAGSGCSYSYRGSVMTVQSSWSSAVGSPPYYGAEIQGINRYLFAPICATDQGRNGYCRLGFSTKYVAKLYAYGMSTQYVVNTEPSKVPACGARQAGFLVVPYQGVGWDASDGYSYNVVELPFNCLTR